MSIQLGSAYGKVSIDSSGVGKGVNDGIKSLQKLERAGELIGGALQKVGAGLTLGVTVPVVAFFKASIDSAMEAESALAELNAVIRSTGGAAGFTADEITKMASELQKVTKFSDDEIVLGQSMLLTFTKIGRDVFPLATEAMLNMAEKFGGVDQAAIQLGKALNDPVAGVGALRRVGVSLTEQQEEQIKGFMAVNDIASAQKIILQELEVEFGGLARAAGDTTAGKMAQLTNAFDDMKETVGAQLIPLLVPLITGLTSLVEKFSTLHPVVQKMILIFLAFAALVGPILLFVGTILSAVSSIAGFVGALSGLGISVAGIGTAFTAAGATISVAVVPALAAVGAALLPILAILASLILFAGLFALAWANDFLWIRSAAQMMVKVVTALWKAFTAFLRGDSDAALAHLQEAFDAFGAHVNKVFENVFGIRDAWGRFLAWMKNALDATVSFIVNVFTKTNWSQIGQYITLGIANGMLGGIPMLVLAATKAGQAALDAIKKKLDISSPSKAFEKLGMFSAQGYALGLAKAMSPEDIARTMARPVNQMSNSQQQNITMQFASGLNTQQVRGMIAENNDQILNTIIGALGGA